MALKRFNDGLFNGDFFMSHFQCVSDCNNFGLERFEKIKNVIIYCQFRV